MVLILIKKIRLETLELDSLRREKVTEKYIYTSVKCLKVCFSLTLLN